jgi:hypothetical protein
MSINELREKAIGAWNYIAELQSKINKAQDVYWDAAREYSNAVALETMGFRIGDVIEFTHTGWRGKTNTVRMEITRFSASLDNEKIPPSVDGVVIKKDGTVGTKSEHYHPGLQGYSKAVLIGRKHVGQL